MIYPSLYKEHQQQTDEALSNDLNALNLRKPGINQAFLLPTCAGLNTVPSNAKLRQAWPASTHRKYLTISAEVFLLSEVLLVALIGKC